MRYTVVIEKAEGNSSAHMPELSGCVASGATVAEVEAQIREAIAFHFEGMREDGLAVQSIRDPENFPLVSRSAE